MEDEENDGTGYVEDDDKQDVDGDNDEEGGEEDEGRYDEDEGGDVEDEGDQEEDRNHLRRQVTHGFHLVKGKMDHPMEDCIVATNRKVMWGYMRFLMGILVIRSQSTCKAICLIEY